MQEIVTDIELKLRRTETRLRLLRGRVPIYMWACDPQLRLTWAWHSSHGDLGDDEVDLAGASLRDIVAHDASGETIVAEHGRAVRGEEVVFSTTYRGRPYRVWLIPHASARGDVLGISGLAAAILPTSDGTVQPEQTPDRWLYGDEAVIRVHDLLICVDRHEAYRAGELVDLTPTEFRLLVLLARRPGLVLTREVLLEQVWGFGFDGGGSMISTAVMRLRSKIERDGGERLIETVRGVGYRLRR